MVKQRELLDKFFQLEKPGIEAFFDALLKLQQISLDSQPFQDIHVGPFLELFSHYFSVSRVSFWHLRSCDRGRFLKCAILYERNLHTPCTGMEMYESDYPDYFRFMDQNVAFAANDSLTHPHTRAFAQSYSIPLDIRSLMDAPLHVLGKVVGIICAEQTGSRREWTEREEGWLIHMASQVSGLLVTQELERQVAKRTADLRDSEQEVRTLAAKLVSEAKMSALGEMAGSIAHEIKNPMTVILGRAIHLCERMERGPIQNDEVKATLKLIERTSERVLQIVQAMKTYTRDASKDPLVAVSVQESVRESLQMMASRLEANAFALNEDISSDLIFRARPGPVLQIFINLISNAIDANEQSPDRWIRVEAQRVADMIQVRVTDSGRGIARKVVERMFLPLYTTKTSSQATGLGLSIAKGIALEMGGDLAYDDSCEHTTFVLTLQAATFGHSNSEIN